MTVKKGIAMGHLGDVKLKARRTMAQVFQDVALAAMYHKKKEQIERTLEAQGVGGVHSEMERSIAKRLLRRAADSASGPPSPGGEDEEEKDMTTDHTRLLYMIDCYTREGSDDKDTWIRKVPCMVLIYEGIVEGCLDYDYAPAPDIVNGKRTYLNISQDGRDDLDDLREEGFLYGLKLSSKKFQSTVAFRVTPFGKQHLADHLTDEDREEVEKFIYVEGKPKTKENLYQVEWDAEEFVFRLVAQSGESKESTITEIESVSYVSSPFIPSVLRKYGRECTNNQDRTKELEDAQSNIKDELDEEITVDNVNIVVAEWIPMGSNQIVALNDKLGSSERVQGGFFTAVVDENPDASEFMGEKEGLSEVDILDFEETTYVNFEAEVHFPEEDGIVQVENFGVYMNDEGFLLYGMKAEGIMHAIQDELSLDNMSRLLVDVHGDSSALVDNLLSPHQRIMLDLTYLGDSESRDKFNVILCSNINPMLPAEEYFDKEAKENELKQVIGDTYSADDLGDGEVLIIGKNGILLCTPDQSKYEQIIVIYLSLMTRNMYLRSLFQRTFILADSLKHIRHLIETSETDPNSITIIRNLLSEASGDIILLSEIQSYLSESLQEMEIPAVPPAGDERKLHDILQLKATWQRLRRRVKDMKKNIDGSKGEVESLREMADVVSEGKGMKVKEAVQANTKNLEDVFRAAERQSASLEMMNVVLAGSLAFDIIDRLHGLYLGIAPDIEWAQKAFSPIYKTPLLLFLLNMGWWACIGTFITYLMKNVSEMASGVLSITYKVNTKMEFTAFKRYLSGKNVEVEDAHADKKTFIKKFSWEESDKVRWQGEPPRVEVVVDTRYHFLLKAFIQVATKKSKVRQDDVKALFFGELREYGIISDEKLKGIEVFGEEGEGEEEPGEEEAPEPKLGTFTALRKSFLKRVESLDAKSKGGAKEAE